MRFGLLSVGMCFGTGCVLGQPSDPLDPIVVPNRPPRIIEETAQPAGQLAEGIDGCRIEFSAFVEDPDVDDRIRYRWYINYDPSSTAPQANRTAWAEGTLQNNGEATRPTSATLAITTGPNNDLGTPREGHEVTLMVFDGILGTFEGPGSTVPADPIPGADAGNPRFASTHTWVVDTDRISCSTEQTP